jgi:hypothetical protein
MCAQVNRYCLSAPLKMLVCDSRNSTEGKSGLGTSASRTLVAGSFLVHPAPNISRFNTEICCKALAPVVVSACKDKEIEKCPFFKY